MNALVRKPNEHVSVELTYAQIIDGLRALPVALRAIVGDSLIVATYGYGSRLHPELWYVPMRVGMSWLPRFIDESLDQRIFVPGSSDLIFNLGNGAVEVEFCHDAHLHLSGTDERLLDYVRHHEIYTFVQWSDGETPNPTFQRTASPPLN